MITEFGGAVAVPSAVRSSDSTTTMRVNDVIMIRMEGATERIVSSAISWIARSVTPPPPWPKLMLISCANAGSASDPAAAIRTGRKKTLRGRFAILTKNSLAAPAGTPSRLRDSQSWSSAARAEGVSLRDGRAGGASGCTGGATLSRRRPAQCSFQPLRHLGEILVGRGGGRRCGGGGGGGGTAARSRIGGGFGGSAGRVGRGIIGSLRGIGSPRGMARRERFGDGARRGRRSARARSRPADRKAVPSEAGAAAWVHGGEPRRQRRAAPGAAAARAWRLGMVEHSDRTGSPSQAVSGSGAMRGGASPAPGRCGIWSRAGMARTMLVSTTTSLGPPIIRRCSMLSRRTSTRRRRPSIAAASITASLGIRPRVVLAPSRLLANRRTSQAAPPIRARTATNAKKNVIVDDMEVPGQLAFHKLRSRPTRTTKRATPRRKQRPRSALFLNSPRQKPAARPSNRPRIARTKTTSGRQDWIACCWLT